MEIKNYTPVEAVKAVNQELKKLFEGKKYSGQGQRKELKFFEFQFPVDFGNDEDVDTLTAASPFILTKADGWSIDAMDKPEVVDLNLIVCTYDNNYADDAVLDLYNIMQDIAQHFKIHNIIGGYFVVQLPINCALQQDDTSPYYFSSIDMSVTTPVMSNENNPDIERLI